MLGLQELPRSAGGSHALDVMSDPRENIRRLSVSPSAVKSGGATTCRHYDYKARLREIPIQKSGERAGEP